MLKLYFDETGTNELNNVTNPDVVHQAVPSGGTIVNELALYVKSDDATLKYENIQQTALGADLNTTVEYALDVTGLPGAYSAILSIPTGQYTVSLKIWRKVTAINVTQAYNKTIQHALTAQEFIA